MRISVNYKPEFTLVLDRPVMPLLMLLSQHHYDAKCREASSWPNKGPTQGFLAGWNNIVEHFSDDLGQATIKATWDQLDTMLKICEGRRGMFGSGPGPEINRLDQFCDFVYAAMRQASTHVPVPYGVLYRCPVCKCIGYDASITGHGCPLCATKQVNK